jgi:hypothetical protein
MTCFQNYVYDLFTGHIILLFSSTTDKPQDFNESFMVTIKGRLTTHDKGKRFKCSVLSETEDPRDTAFLLP